MVVLAAVLIGAAGWWVESNREEAPEGEQESAEILASDRESSMDSATSEAGNVVEPHGVEPALQESVTELTREPLADQAFEFPGPTAELLVQVKARQDFFYRSPASTDVELEVFYETGEADRLLNPKEDAIKLGMVKTDSTGFGAIALRLPTGEDGAWKKGYLLFKTLTPGWQDPKPERSSNARVSIGSLRGEESVLEMVLRPGVTVPVRALGALAQEERGGPDLRLTVEDLDSGKKTYPFFYPYLDSGEPTFLAMMSVEKAGRFRLTAHGKGGVGSQRSIHIDPAAPPSEVTILIQPFGTIQGKLLLPEGMRSERFRVIAVHTDDAEVEAPSDASPNPYAFPPRIARVNADKDGHFTLNGLAPGSYRIGWGPAYVNADWPTRWFSLEPVPTGTKDLQLEIPVSRMDIRLLSEDGLILPSYGKASPTMVVTKEPRSRGGYSYEITPTPAENGPVYPLVQGNRYKVLVWGSGVGVHERLVTEFPDGEAWTLDLQVSRPEMGKLKWTGPAAKIDYEVRTLDLDQVLYSWGRRWVHAEPMEVDLPVGSYLFRARGRTPTGNHGEVGKHRTPYGVEEHRVEILPGQTTTVACDPPKNGSLEIRLDAAGLPDSELYPHSFSDLPADVILEDSHPWGEITFVLRSSLDGRAVGLRFQNQQIGIAVRSYSVGLGATHIPLQTFPPGEYTLETRTPGFPLESQTILIEAGKRTKVEVLVSNL